MAIQQKTLIRALSEANSKILRLSKQLRDFSFGDSKKITFKTNNFTVNEVVKDLPIGSHENDYVYIFKVVKQNQTNRELFKLLKAEKHKQSNEDDKKDLPRINDVHKGSQYLYVGRSQNLKSRIRQHLGKNYRGTYAMHMERWCMNTEEVVEISYYKLENKDNLLVQAVEDSLWDELKPCFGRKGDK